MNRLQIRRAVLVATALTLAAAGPVSARTPAYADATAAAPADWRKR